MRTQPTSGISWPEEVVLSNGIFVASGYGLRISVWRGRLRVGDGFGKARREVLLHRATSRLKRLVVIGHTGSISLEAFQWLAGIKAAYLQIDPDGRVLASIAPLRTDRARLRRAQARAIDSAVGLEIARQLISDKIVGQQQSLDAVAELVDVPEGIAAAISKALLAASAAPDTQSLLLAEANAAAAYWAAWSDLPLRFARRDLSSIPSHWKTFGTRSSPLTPGPRLAVNPANALLNYLYAVLETEATIALRIVGLDPGLGIFHVDQDNRDSLAADVMEPVRPVVDRFLINLVRRRTFAATDVYETSTGVCRLGAGLAHDLWSVAPEISAQVGKIAEDIAHRLDGTNGATPITGRQRQTARPYGRLRGMPAEVMAVGRSSCEWCGGRIKSGKIICSTCTPEWRAQRTEHFVSSGIAGLRRLRQAGKDPLRSAAARKKVADARRRIHAEQVEWERSHGAPSDPALFARDILPAIREVPVRRLAKITGLSVNYCATIRRGERTPHARWWSAFGDAARDAEPK